MPAAGMATDGDGGRTRAGSGSHPLVSTIIPSYLRFELLWEAIGSVLRQTVRDVEIIVVDDASPQPTRVPDDPRVRLIRRSTNGSPGAARNTGLGAARGTYVTFLDDDDLYAPERLALGLEAVERGADIGLCRIRPWAGARGRHWRRYARNENRILDGSVHDVILDRIRPHLGQITIRREAAPLFDERFIHAEDLEWWLRASQGAIVATIPRVGYLLRNHEGPQFSRQLSDRVGYKFLLLQVHEAYFRTHPRAAAQQWAGIGKLAGWLGHRRLARQALVRALRLDPQISTMRRLVEALRPGDRPAVYPIPDAVAAEWLRDQAEGLALRYELVPEATFRHAS